MIAQAQSGTGKTATFAISILQRIDIGKRACQALVLAPTRELAQQIQKVTPSMCAVYVLRCVWYITQSMDVVRSHGELLLELSVITGVSDYRGCFHNHFVLGIIPWSEFLKGHKGRKGEGHKGHSITKELTISTCSQLCCTVFCVLTHLLCVCRW